MRTRMIYYFEDDDGVSPARAPLVEDWPQDVREKAWAFITHARDVGPSNVQARWITTMKNQGGHDLRRVVEICVDVGNWRYRVFLRLDRDGDDELIVLLCCGDKRERTAMADSVYSEVAAIRDAYEQSRRRALAEVPS